MTSLQIDKLNENISYPDGKIYFSANKGHTSILIQNLYKHGWRVGSSGCVYTLYDNNNHKVTSAYSWEQLLQNAAIQMR